MFLLAYARDQHGWKRIVAQFERETELFGAIASGFAWHTTWALDRGLLRGYVSREESRHDVRGRVLFGEQIARSAGLPLPVRVGYDDFTVDVLENRMLLTATQLLLRLPRIPLEARKRLRHVSSVLDGVQTLVDWRGTAVPPITRLNERYASALRLAEIVLAGASLSAAVGDVRSTTFVFDMNKVFEDFLTAALNASMRPYGGELRDQMKPYSLDEEGLLALKPDLSWWLGKTCSAVIDAKYKEVEAGVMKHPDAYQMLAYCIAYDLPAGYLVYAKDSGQEARTHRIRHSGHDIVVATIDVEKHPDELLADVDLLAARIAGDAADRGIAADVA